MVEHFLGKEEVTGSSPVIGSLARPSIGKFTFYFLAEIAQLVEHNLAKVGVASSSLVFRSLFHRTANVAQW